MGAQHGEPQRPAGPGPSPERVGCQELADGDEVAEALRHLLAFHLQESVVHPDIRHALAAEGAAGLGDLVLVVGEDEVDPAAVNVERVADRVVALQPAAERLQELGHRHGRALDVPARAAGRCDAGRARPAGLVRLRRLPQHEIHRVALVGGDVDARAGQHLVERAAGERTVAWRAGQRVHRRGRKQHVILGHVSHASGDEALDHRPHLVDVLGCARLVCGRQDPERGDILVKLPPRRFGDFCDRLVERQVGKVADCAGVDLVVDVGDVARINHMVRPVDLAEQAEQNVEHDHRPGVADMGVVVDRGPADIDPHRRRIDGRELLLAAGQGVVEAQGHQTSRLQARRRSGAVRDRPDNRFSKGLVENGDANQPALELAGNEDGLGDGDRKRHGRLHRASWQGCQAATAKTG